MTTTSNTFVDVAVGSDFARGKLHLSGTMQIGDVTHVVSNRIVELEDALIRQKLIELGWSPPSTEQNKAP